MIWLALGFLCVVVIVGYDMANRPKPITTDDQDRADRLTQKRQEAVHKMQRHQIKPITERDRLNRYELESLKPKVRVINLRRKA